MTTTEPPRTEDENAHGLVGHILLQFGHKRVLVAPLHDPAFPTASPAPGPVDWAGVANTLALVMDRPFESVEHYLAMRRYLYGDSYAVRLAENIIRFGDSARFRADPLGWCMVKPDWYENTKIGRGGEKRGISRNEFRDCSGGEE